MIRLRLLNGELVLFSKNKMPQLHHRDSERLAYPFRLLEVIRASEFRRIAVMIQGPK